MSFSCLFVLFWFRDFVIDFVAPAPIVEFILIRPHFGNDSLPSGATRAKNAHQISAELALPVPTQSTDRILVAITLGNLGPAKRQLSLTLQLDHYLSLCEDGYEVHIVFVTKEVNFDQNTFGFGSHSRYHCFRTGVSMPMFLWTWKIRSSPFLAAYHRRLFSDYSTAYDWFISQEDDTIIRSANFKYFRKYSAAFGERPLYPGFAIVEKPAIQHQSLMWLSFIGGRQIMDVANVSGLVSLIMLKPWAPVYILSQPMLARATAHRSWKLDEFCASDCGEINVHFQHMWLTSFYKIVIPLEAIDDAFLHHSPDSYSEHSIKNFAGTTVNRDAVVLEELLYVMQSCAGVVTPKFEFKQLKIRYRAEKAYARRIAHPHPCRSCLNLNMTASLRVEFHGEIKRAIAFESALINVFISCANDLVEQVNYHYPSKKFEVRVKNRSQ